MSTELAREAVAVMPSTRQDRYDDPKMVEVIKETVCKGASNAQLRMFIEVCRRTHLDPFLKEIFFVPEKSIIMASRDGYLRVANEDPNFDGMKTVVERNAQNIPIKATCTVWRKDRNHPIECEAYFSEYRKSSPVWTTYPSAMISKVAEVLALKRSFAINGVVTEEEIGNDGAGSVEAAKQVAREKIAALGGDPAVVDVKSGTFLKLVAAFDQVAAEFASLGHPEAYDELLWQHGVRFASEFEDTPEGLKAARKCYKALSLPLAQLRHPEPVEPEVNTAEDLKAATDANFGGTFSIPDCIKRFTSKKEEFFKVCGVSAGEAEYRRILKAHGMKSSNQFRTAAEAIPCLAAMDEELRRLAEEMATE